MKIVIQRSNEASVSVDNKTISKIDYGYVLLIGFTNGDDKNIVDKMVNKIVNLRIFSDENDKLNLSIKDGRRPSFTDALNYNDAKKLYDYFNFRLEQEKIDVQTGEFGADMKVSLINDGPVTIIIDSKEDF